MKHERSVAIVILVVVCSMFGCSTMQTKGSDPLIGRQALQSQYLNEKYVGAITSSKTTSGKTWVLVHVPEAIRLSVQYVFLVRGVCSQEKVSWNDTSRLGWKKHYLHLSRFEPSMTEYSANLEDIDFQELLNDKYVIYYSSLDRDDLLCTSSTNKLREKEKNRKEPLWTTANILSKTDPKISGIATISKSSGSATRIDIDLKTFSDSNLNAFIKFGDCRDTTAKVKQLNPIINGKSATQTEIDFQLAYSGRLTLMVDDRKHSICIPLQP